MFTAHGLPPANLGLFVGIFAVAPLYCVDVRDTPFAGGDLAAWRNGVYSGTPSWGCVWGWGLIEGRVFRLGLRWGHVVFADSCVFLPEEKVATSVAIGTSVDCLYKTVKNATESAMGWDGMDGVVGVGSGVVG